MIEWKPSDGSGGMQAVFEGSRLFVFPSRLMGWSWHATIPNVIHVQGYADTQQAAMTMAEQAAKESK